MMSFVVILVLANLVELGEILLPVVMDKVLIQVVIKGTIYFDIVKVIFKVRCMSHDEDYFE